MRSLRDYDTLKVVNLTLKRPVTVCPSLVWCYLHHFFSTSSIVQALTSFLTSEVLWSGSIKWSFLQFILTFAMRRKLLGNFRGHFQSWFTSLANFILFRKNSQLWFLKNKSWFIILELCSFVLWLGQDCHGFWVYDLQPSLSALLLSLTLLTMP